MEGVLRRTEIKERIKEFGGGKPSLVLFAAFLAAILIALHITTTRPHAHIARRYHRGNRVLVDHLADRIAQQYDELIERLDRALQLDAIDLVHRHRYPLAPQRIQE